MNKVLYDNQIFNLQKFGGISRYFTELFKGINNTGVISSFPAKYFSENKHLRNNQLTYLDSFADGFHFRGKKRIENYLKLRETQTIRRELKNGNFNVFHPTYYNTYFLEHLSDHKPFVLTVHDMIHEIYYDHLLERRSEETKNKRILIPKASHIIAVSQKTKDDILAFFPEVNESKVSVIYHGSSLTTTVEKSSIQLPGKYILYVGNRVWYKNFRWFLKSVAGLLRNNDLTLVCAGGGNFTDYENDLLLECQVTEKVKFVEINNDVDLKAIYRNARALIFPSLYEGFGIPILEAFSCECPVILINASCFPEIAGDAALYFEKDDAETLIKHVHSILEDPSLSAHLKVLGRKRLELYSWKKTINQHIEIYKQF